MKTSNRSAAAGATAALSALAVTVLVAVLPIGAGLLVAAVVFAGVACVASAARSRLFEGEQRLVYRPVYARARIVHRRVRASDE